MNQHENAFLHPTAVVMGDVTLGKEASLWPHAVVRGDIAAVVIGERSNVQDCAVLHVSMGISTIIGKGVTIGHNATVHACTVEDDALIGMGATVLDGAVIGAGSIIGAGAVVSPGTIVPPRSLVVGVPGKVRRETTEEELTANRANAQEYVHLAHKWLTPKPSIVRHEIVEEYALSGFVEAGDFVFLGFCVGNVGQSVERQVEGALDDMENRLGKYGLTLNDVVKLDVLLRDVWNIPVMEEIFQRRFQGHYPARKTIQTEFAHKGGQEGLLAQIDATAYRGTKR